MIEHSEKEMSLSWDNMFSWVNKGTFYCPNIMAKKLGNFMSQFFKMPQFFGHHNGTQYNDNKIGTFFEKMVQIVPMKKRNKHHPNTVPGKPCYRALSSTCSSILNCFCKEQL